jgi:hypothetical protein
MNLGPRDRTEAAIAVLVVTIALILAGIYALVRYLLAAILS